MNSPSGRASIWLASLLCSSAALADGTGAACRRYLRLAAANPRSLALPNTARVPAATADTAPGHLLASLDQPITVTGGHLDMALEGSFDLTGQVLVRFGDSELHTEALHYDAGTNLLRLDSDVRLQNPSLIVHGSSGRYGDDGASFTRAEFAMRQQPGRGQAGQILITPRDVVELRDVRYTTCPPESTDWELRADRIDLDTRTQRGSGRGTRVVFKGVPIVYLPWISFPLSNARQTGLLFPAIGSSTSAGATLSVPWYWNIAPEKDLTLTGTEYSLRGAALGTEYRQLNGSGHSELRYDYLGYDRVARATRHYGKLDMHYRLGREGWQGLIEAEDVSDVHYFEDYERGTRNSSTAFLSRRLALDYRDEHWRVDAELRNTQTLDAALASTDRPYAELPRISLLGRWGEAMGPAAELSGEYGWFSRSTGPQGGRLDLTPAVQWNLQGAGYYLRPRAAWEASWYQLGHADPGQSGSPARQLPVLSFDSALELERPAAAGHHLRFTLVPRLYYVYIPFRDQSMLPVFDSGLPDPNFVTLFRPNRYVGADRVGDSNSLAMGLTFNVSDGRTGEWRLRATLGQSVQFAAPRVRLPSELPSSQRASSLVANVDLRALNHVTLKLDAAWDRDNARLQKFNSEWQYRLSGEELLNVGYRYSRGSIQQGDTSIAWPLGKHWSAYGLAAYSLLDRQLTTRFAGLRYRGNCWGLSAVASRSISTRTGALQSGFYLQLELNGLSSVGTDANAFLRNSIRGYSDHAP